MCNETVLFTQDGRSPLHVAVKKDHMDIVANLLKHGASTNAKDRVRNL